MMEGGQATTPAYSVTPEQFDAVTVDPALDPLVARVLGLIAGRSKDKVAIGPIGVFNGEISTLDDAGQVNSLFHFYGNATVGFPDGVFVDIAFVEGIAHAGVPDDVPPAPVRVMLDKSLGLSVAPLSLEQKEALDRAMESIGSPQLRLH